VRYECQQFARLHRLKKRFHRLRFDPRNQTTIAHLLAVRGDIIKAGIVLPKNPSQ
jgi:hypothetical protein